MLDGTNFALLTGPRKDKRLAGQSAAKPPRATRCNQAVPAPLTAGERESMIHSAAAKLQELFDILRIDHQNDHNTHGTPRRVAKMLVEETMRGRFAEAPSITAFENVNAFDQLLVTGPIEVRSTCAHHLMPIYGEAYIGVLPSASGKIIGLSKYDRIVDHFSARLQIQEELVQQIGDFIMEQTAPRGLAVRISAVHMCKTHRGVRGTHGARMATSTYFGALRTDDRLRDEFHRECLSLARRCTPA
jgi:GTP cyclohydrolase IA